MQKDIKDIEIFVKSNLLVIVLDELDDDEEVECFRMGDNL